MMYSSEIEHRAPLRPTHTVEQSLIVDRPPESGPPESGFAPPPPPPEMGYNQFTLTYRTVSIQGDPSILGSPDFPSFPGNGGNYLTEPVARAPI